MENSPSRHVYALTLRRVHAFMVARGFETAELLVNTELRKADIEDTYRLITEDQARLFYLNALRLVDSCGIGLEIGWTTPLAETGPHGLLQIAAKTIRHAIEETWPTRNNYNLLTNWNFEITNGVFIQHLSAEEEDEALRIFLLERGLGMTQAHAEELVGPDARPIKVLLDYRPPRNSQRYKDIFRCPVHFGQQSVEVHYPASYLDIDLQSYDPQAFQALELLQEQLLKKLSTKVDILNEVRMALRRESGKFPSLEQVAGKLAMSPRSVRRKLGQRDVHFQDLLNEERQRIAEDLLVNSQMTIQQVAEECGFSDAQGLSQAFKRWVGVTPSEYRRSRGE